MRTDKCLTDIEAAALEQTNHKTFQKLSRESQLDAVKEGGNMQDFGRMMRQHGKLLFVALFLLAFLFPVGAFSE